MQINGSYQFQASQKQVFMALINPVILQKTIPGCQEAWFADGNPDIIKIRLVTPIPSLEGPYDFTITVLEQEDPRAMVLQAGRAGHTAGSINTITHITLADTAETFLTYETTTELEGPIAFANNPLFQRLAKHSLKTFFKNLNTALVTPA